MNQHYECLYFLDNATLAVLEVKFYENNSDVPKFQWLLVQKHDLRVRPLAFQSMDSSGQIEERFFDLGYLKFDPEKGVFIEKNNLAQHHLQHSGRSSITEEIREATLDYLNKSRLQEC